MQGLTQKLIGGAAVLLALCAVWPTAAELADVYLKSGLRLRGDVTTAADEVVLRNAAGEVRIPRADVEKIVPVQAAAAAPARPAGPAATAPTQPIVDAPEAPELPPAPSLSERDIQRLRLHELMLVGPPETVSVRFLRRGKQRELPLEVLDELRRRPDFRTEWEDVLLRGLPREQLQLIVRLTGLQHADRIVIESDPVVFDVFRRRVLPAVNRGCARAGCHSGKNAHVFRFPAGNSDSETYAYTTFVLLDQMQTSQGALIDRGSPERSLLLEYLLPPELTERAHPQGERARVPFKPLARNRTDRLYLAVQDWISYLSVPRPDYGLDYVSPYAAPARATPAPPATEPAGVTQ